MIKFIEYKSNHKINQNNIKKSKKTIFELISIKLF